MKRNLVIVVLLIASPLVACVASELTTVGPKYTALWTARLDAHRTLYKQRAQAAKAEVARFVAMISRSPATPASTRDRLKNIGTLIYRTAVAEGQGRTLKRFWQAFSKRRSVGLMSAWVQREAGDIQALDTASRKRIAEFVRASNRPATARDWYNRYESIHKARGLLEGARAELWHLRMDVDGYAADMESARRINGERRRAIAGVMIVVGAAIILSQQYTYQRQMALALPRTITCTKIGIFINCDY